MGELEGAVTQLTHFITQQYRPDLSGSPLSHESESQQLQKDAADAKQSKDYKDVEKQSEI